MTVWDDDDVASMRTTLDRLYVARRLPTVPPYWARRDARSRWDGEREHSLPRARRRVRLAYEPAERCGQIRVRYKRPVGWMDPNASPWLCPLALEAGGKGCRWCDAVPHAEPLRSDRRNVASRAEAETTCAASTSEPTPTAS